MVVYLAQSGMHTVFIPHLLKSHNYHVITSLFLYLIYKKHIELLTVIFFRISTSITQLVILQFLEFRVLREVRFLPR